MNETQEMLVARELFMRCQALQKEADHWRRECEELRAELATLRCMKPGDIGGP